MQYTSKIAINTTGDLKELFGLLYRNHSDIAEDLYIFEDQLRMNSTWHGSNIIVVLEDITKNNTTGELITLEFKDIYIMTSGGLPIFKIEKVIGKT